MLSRILSLILILCISPILIFISFLIIIDDGFPILFKQKRVGQNNNHFIIFKFRTMKKDIPDLATHLVNNTHSLYTYVGPFLRKFSLDELPQLINVIKGDMRFIGPRPALHNQDDLIELRTHIGVHRLVPGLTGWAQVNGRDELSIPDKVKMDEYYLKNKSFYLNMKIIIKTFMKVFNAEGVSK